ncbi:tagatose 6-phosphate kinase [Thermolongibacillus altinsuensis]|uniref:Tagatose-6-phosphate kinase n=1 Tax=Thermolongibacillus altinsuensis TaxID=575256 RepID=A0A4R1QFH3_9BACL|nr:1-phosphofructokinase [Thermolongibacillus altinsuensis]TCL43946.1 tagatose 6-phosphate kinase [Thermolongibacillus altinsuensis]
MILTITLNPSVDINYKLDSLHLNEVNRCYRVIKTAGGKGLNVTRVIQLAGENVCATGFLGGTTGEFIENVLNENNINHQFIKIQGETRHCIAILHNGKQTEILEAGPCITEEEASTFIENYKNIINNVDVVVASGSLPIGLDSSFYQKLINIANEKGKKFILDTSGEALGEGLKANPYLIKPNKDELSKLLNIEKITTIQDVKEAINYLKEQFDIEYIIVSLGEKGAVGFHGGKFYIATPPKVRAVNPVGSGDSMVAGFAIAIARNLDPIETLKYGCAFGTLNAIEEKTGYIQPKLINSFITETEVSVLT